MTDAEQAWHYAIARQRHGPVTRAQLGQLIRAGTLASNALVWRAPMTDWAPIGQLEELAEFEAAPPTTPADIPRWQPPEGADPAIRLLLPVGRSGWAIAAGYLGLFSVLGIFAPLAIITGILAIRDIRRHPQRCGMGRAIFGIAMGAVFCVGYTLAMVIPL